MQLEDVKDVGIAEVKINGKDKGVLWTKPFRIEISEELQKGENKLQIKVVNSWLPATLLYQEFTTLICSEFSPF